MSRHSSFQIRVPRNSAEIETMLEVRLTVAEEAYSTEGKATPEEVRSELSRDNPRIRESIETGGYQALCALIGEKIVGMCVWSKRNATTNRLEHLYILQEEQRKGYGSSMFDMALEDMGDSKPIKLTTQDAQKLYETRGFVTTDEWDTDRINTEQVMIRPALSP